MSTLEDLAALEAKATPGPWRARTMIQGSREYPETWGDSLFVASHGDDRGWHDSALIAASRNALPDLLRIAREVSWTRQNTGTCIFCHALDADQDKHAATCTWALARKLGGF